MAEEKQTLFQKLISQKEIDVPEKRGLRYSMVMKGVIIIFTMMSSAVFFTLPYLTRNSDHDNFLLEPEKVWQDEPLIADFSFPILKDKETLEKEIREKKKDVLKIFTVKNVNIESYEKNITDIIDNVENLNILATINKDFSLPSRVVNEFIEQDENDLKKAKSSIKKEITSIVKNAYSKGFINNEIDKIEHNEIEVKTEPNESYYLKKQFLFDEKKFLEEGEAKLKNKFKGADLNFALELLRIVNKPNLEYSEELSSKALEMADKSVARTLGIVSKGDVIVKKGEELNEESILLVKSYFKTRNIITEKKLSPIFYIGSFGHAALLITIFMIYLAFIRKRIFYDNLQLSIILGSIIVGSFLSWLSVDLKVDLPLEFLVFIPAFSILIAIVFDSRTAFYMTVTMSLILAGIRGNDYAIATTMIFAGMLAAYTVKDIQRRMQMFQSMFFILIGLVLPIMIFAAERSSDWIQITQKLSLGLINSIVSPFIAFGLLIIIERITNITTDLRIKEYDNLNHPLLVKLGEVAPGTYQHSLGVAHLSEKCAHVINANALLVRVASYFHDIGKMSKPEYFAENQINMDNKHELISPRKSATTIRDHVTIGVDLAKQYKLPDRLIDFIKSHHGTTLIKHFYAKALEDKLNGEIEEADFRYPGPKPISREEAIVMVCDTAEAISRIGSITESETLEIINETIQDKILDGQFSNCRITMKELELIKETILKTLKGMGHQRVVYKQVQKQSI